MHSNNRREGCAFAGYRLYPDRSYCTLKEADANVRCKDFEADNI
ncbi:MAG: hypothetical protein NUW37_06130 [Planctomycetes bacterium]|nr:hypothetical protein [Planctomycetota bacterium]